MLHPPPQIGTKINIIGEQRIVCQPIDAMIELVAPESLRALLGTEAHANEVSIGPRDCVEGVKCANHTIESQRSNGVKGSSIKLDVDASHLFDIEYLLLARKIGPDGAQFLAFNEFHKNIVCAPVADTITVQGPDWNSGMISQVFERGDFGEYW
jgi:hypothetical protein